MADPEQVTVWSMPHTVEQSLSAAQDAANTLPTDVSPTFIKADTFTAQHEGGITRNDSLGGTAAFGIDQKAHPNIDVTKLTADKAQAMRYEYWRAVGGDELAKKSPALAVEAYDTAIMSGPDRSQQFLKGAQGDPNKFLQQREQFFHHLESQPAYAGATPGWENRNRDLRAEIQKNAGPDRVASTKNPPKSKEAGIKRNKYAMRTPPNKLRNLYT
jgi:lysozyme family protein